MIHVYTAIKQEMGRFPHDGVREACQLRIELQDPAET